jgi:shikimate kinase
MGYSIVMSSGREMRNLALVGFMGTGKTTIGHMVAAQLGFEFVDTDELIETQTKRKIAEIFKTDGEATFRNLEADVVRSLAAARDKVISTGGGLVTRPENMNALKEHALVICLWASAETIFKRVGHQGHRPLLHTADPLATIRDLLAKREPFYRAADILVNTEMRSSREVVTQVVHHFKHAAQGIP